MSTTVPNPLTDHNPPTSGGSGGVSDGDYGDVVVSGSNTVWTVEDSATWDAYVVKSANQDVTNSNTYTSDSELTFAGANGQTWWVEMYLIVGGNSSAGDIKTQLAATTGNFRWALRLLGDSSAGIVNPTPVAGVGTNVAAPGLIALDGANKFHLFIQGWIEFGATQSVALQFAQNTATIATYARIYAGSILRAKRLD